MSQLESDLKTYADEAWNRRDIKAGLKLLGELAGIGGLCGLGYVVLTSWVPGLNALGIPISVGLAGQLLKAAYQHYADMAEEEREVVRKVVRVLHGIGIG